MTAHRKHNNLNLRIRKAQDKIAEDQPANIAHLHDGLRVILRRLLVLPLQLSARICYDRKLKKT